MRFVVCLQCCDTPMALFFIAGGHETKNKDRYDEKKEAYIDK